jgi:hypothetical protein
MNILFEKKQVKNKNEWNRIIEQGKTHKESQRRHNKKKKQYLLKSLPLPTFAIVLSSPSTPKIISLVSFPHLLHLAAYYNFPKRPNSNVWEQHAPCSAHF